MAKTPEQIAADEAQASREQREQMAKDANKKRNDALLEARNAIADRADELKTEEDDLVPLTDEIWNQEDRPDAPHRKTRAELLAEAEAAEAEAASEQQTEDEAAAALIRQQEELDKEQDEARDAGADDQRRNAKGQIEYRVGEEWFTLAQLRARAGQGRDDSPSGQEGEDGATTAPTRVPSPQAAELQRQAEERKKAEKQALRERLRDLNIRASMGDEQAIDELTDLQLEAISGDSDRLLAKVDERVDARVEGRTAFERAVEWFESKDGYATELAAPGFKQKAAQIDKRLASERPDLSPRQRLDLVGRELRTELKQIAEYLGAAPSPRGGQPPANPKLARKQQSDQVPRAAGRTRPEVEPDEVQTTQDAIQQLARSRGQNRPITHKH